MNKKSLNEPSSTEAILNREQSTHGSSSTAWQEDIESIFKSMESSDPYTAGHQKKVASISRAIGQKLGWDKERSQALYMAAMVHDLGKMSVPSEILTKPSKLTDLELQLVQGHAEAGFQILKAIPFPWPIAEIVHQHHERLDGSGYPNGLAGNEICEEARVIAVADTLESMANSRPYRPAKGLAAALAEIKAEAGTKLDLRVVEAVFQLLADGNELQQMIDA